MASVAEVRKFLLSNYDMTLLDSGNMVSVFTFEDGRSQGVHFYFDDDFLIVSSGFGSTKDMTPKQALDAPTFLGIKLLGDTYAVTHIIPIADLDPSEVQKGIELVCTHADYVEEKLVGSDNN